MLHAPYLVQSTRINLIDKNGLDNIDEVSS